MTYIVIKGDELYHHGVVGMHWGVRRYQNADGSLKPAGRKRYTEGGGKKQLTDEERAARRKKIAKTVAAVAGTAVVAAGAYAATKYLKKTMAEADKIMATEKSKTLDDLFKDVMAADDNAINARNSWWHTIETNQSTATQSQHKAYFDAQNKYAKQMKDRYNNAKRIMDDNASNDKVRRMATKELVKRDVTLAKRAATQKAKKVMKKPTMSKLDRYWADYDTRGRAQRRVQDLLYTDRETPMEKQLREFADRQAEKIKNRR